MNEKLPTLDLDSFNGPNTPRNVLYDETVEGLQKAAAKLGGFSVKILAQAGEQYQLTRKSELTDSVSVSPPITVPEGHVFVEMSNTADQNDPTNLQPLWDESYRQ